MQPNKSKATLQLVIATLLSLFGMLLAQQPDRVLGRRAGVNDQWLFRLAGGLLLLGTAFVTAPPGEIHSSVLIAYGEVMTFAGALFGIDYHYRR